MLFYFFMFYRTGVLNANVLAFIISDLPAVGVVPDSQPMAYVLSIW